MYTFSFHSFISTYRAPVKFTPVTLKGTSSCTRLFGSGAGSGAWYGFPITFRQLMHLRNTDLTDWRAVGIQNYCRNVVTVEFTPACNWFWWAFSITRLVKNCFGGNRYRNFVSTSTGAFWMLPPPPTAKKAVLIKEGSKLTYQW